MSDVFISYARSTESRAAAIAEALREAGFSVWRDDALSAHRNFSQEIQEQLAAAKAVLVIWSADAVRSEWVQSEADRARQDRKLVQLRIDQVALPMPFDRIQCADLCEGALDTPAWATVVASLRELATATEAAHAARSSPGGLSAPRLAVMPFANLSSDPDQAYFVEGIVEEIVAALSSYRSLAVVAAGGTMAAMGRPLSPQDAARDLGVRYLLEGSVRKAGSRVRISLHLVETESGAELWTDRLEDDLADVFALQDRVAERVAGVAEGAMQDADMRTVASRPTTNLSSYDLYMRAMFLFRISRREEIAQAIDLLDQAVALDPNFALALSQACVCYRQLIDHAWTDDPLAVRRKGLEYADRALRIAAAAPRVVAQVAISLPGLDGHMARALPLIERAVALNPRSGFIWLASGSLHLRNGDPETAAAHLETAMRLDPISSVNGFTRAYLASAQFQLHRFDEALALFQTTTYRLPVSHLILASLHGHLGQAELAREALESFHRADAGSIDHLAKIWFPRPENRQLLYDGLAPVGAEAGPAR
ncbi:MAG TPA: TIR domain-containing protein [Caulobacteraceae bacterium]